MSACSGHLPLELPVSPFANGIGNFCPVSHAQKVPEKGTNGLGKPHFFNGLCNYHLLGRNVVAGGRTTTPSHSPGPKAQGKSSPATAESEKSLALWPTDIHVRVRTLAHRSNAYPIGINLCLRDSENIQVILEERSVMTNTSTTEDASTDSRNVWSLRRAFYFVVLSSTIMWVTTWKIAFALI